MIDYDPHRKLDLCHFKGSVLPTACIMALPTAILAYVLRKLAVEGILRTDVPEIISTSNVFADFTFLLGATLTFRSSEAYLRYWEAADLLFQMSAEFADACACLVAFAYNSIQGDGEVVHSFSHTVVRLFCLMHALALEDLSMLEEDMPLIDPRGIDAESLRALLLKEEDHPGERVRVVITWIKDLIVKHMSDGTLDLPAPILSRVFEELSLGTEHFHEAQKFERWPLPFPHTQYSLTLIHLYMAVTPLILSTMDLNPWACCLTCFFCVVCMLSLDLIAAEVVQPFGTDDNDMPMYDMQAEMNRRLTILLNPTTWATPGFSDQVDLNRRELGRQQLHELDQYYREQASGAAPEPSLRTTWKDDVLRNTLRKPAAGRLHISGERAREAQCAKQEGRRPSPAPDRASALVLQSEKRREELPCPQEFMQELRSILQKQSEQNLQQLHRLAEWEHQHQLLLQESQLNSMERIFGCGEDDSVAEVASLKHRLPPEATGGFLTSASSSFPTAPASMSLLDNPWHK